MEERIGYYNQQFGIPSYQNVLILIVVEERIGSGRGS